MKRLVDLVKLDRLDNLIRKEATGTPNELAEKLKISRSNLFEFISFLRYEMFAPINYNKEKRSYIYTYIPKFYLGFEKNKHVSMEISDMENSWKNEMNSFLNKDRSDFIFDEDTLVNGFSQVEESEYF